MTAVPVVYISSTGPTLVFEHFQQCWEFSLARQVQIRSLSTNEMRSPCFAEFGAPSVLRSEEIPVAEFADVAKIEEMQRKFKKAGTTGWLVDTRERSGCLVFG
jgi:hypothetical protein